MKSRLFRLRSIPAAVAAIVAVSGLSADNSFAGSPVYVDDSGTLNQGSVTHFLNNNKASTARYIVRFKEAPVAVHFAAEQGAGVASVGGVYVSGKNGRTRLNVANSTVRAYAAQLDGLQQQRLSDIRTAIGHDPIKPKRYQMLHALNAVVLQLSPAEAQSVLKVDGVVAVTRDRPHALATDIGPGFIGASSVWWGASAGQDTIYAGGFDDQGGYRGDSIVIGDIDTGYNSMSPSFQPTDANGYTVQNPLGSGNFLPQSQCNVANISLAGCNDKVIGVYDEIDLTNSDPSFTGAYSVEDVQGHGSHTASTAGGDGRTFSLSGYSARASGVAPHANLVIYYACSPNSNVQCSDAATSGSVDQAIQDGIVDALNFSISGGVDPWNDPTSLAFLSAADAGIFIAAAAGNTGNGVPLPLPGTANHNEPWVTTVAAGTHPGGGIGPALSVTGPGAPPTNVQNIPLTEGSGDTTPNATLSAPMNLSPTFHNLDSSGTDGCTSFTAGQFASAFALISRGGCAFSTKVTNAVAAGARVVIFSDNSVEAPFTASVPSATVPVYTITQAQGSALRTFLAAHSNTAPTVIPHTPIRQPAQPDVLANFSLLGPVGIDVIKPDVQAPGVNIIASIANDGTTDGPNLVALYDGTSMATPHTTGSGALLMGLHPDWTAQETRSALMMTAVEQGLTKPDGITPSDYFDRGSGRLQDFAASRSGLVLNETGLNFTNANPAKGGSPSTLNIASMQSAACLNASTVTCSFTRKFRSTQDHVVTWTAAVAGVSATVTPSSFSVPARSNALPIEVTVDATSYNGDNVYHFGEMTLTPSDTTLPTLHMPIAVKVPPPVISASPSAVAIAFNPSFPTTNNGYLTVSNIGGAPLVISNTNDSTTAAAKYVLVDQPSSNMGGWYNDFFTDFGIGSYAADDFVVAVGGTNLSNISVPGFSEGATLAQSVGTPVHFRIYADAPGFPNGDPENGTSANAPLYQFDTQVGANGLTVTGDTISLNLATAGAPATNLAAGTYWLLVSVDEDSRLGYWQQFDSLQSNGNSGMVYDRLFGDTAWKPFAADFSPNPGLAMHIDQLVPCGISSFATASPSTMTITSGQSDYLAINATAKGFGYLCLDSNDPATPILVVPVTSQ